MQVCWQQFVNLGKRYLAMQRPPVVNETRDCMHICTLPVCMSFMLSTMQIARQSGHHLLPVQLLIQSHAQVQSSLLQH